MKITEQHVSEKRIGKMIAVFQAYRLKEVIVARYADDIVKSLLELKQRRYEDRQREELGRLGHFHKVDENGL